MSVFIDEHADQIGLYKNELFFKIIQIAEMLIKSCFWLSEECAYQIRPSWTDPLLPE